MIQHKKHFLIIKPKDEFLRTLKKKDYYEVMRFCRNVRRQLMREIYGENFER